MKSSVEDRRTVSLPQRHMLQFSISQLKSCPMTESPEDPKLLERASTGAGRTPAVPAGRYQGAERRGPAGLGVHEGPVPAALGDQPLGSGSRGRG